MALAYTNGRVLLPRGFDDDSVVVVDQGRIVAIGDSGVIPSGAECRDLDGKFLVPGFIDVQVNGGGGVLFNDDPSVETIRRIGEAHRRYGTTGFLPTLITDELDIVRAGIAAVDEAIATGVPGVLGIHIEGPFLNPARKGIHDAQFMRRLGESELELLTGLKRGRTLLTLAPEQTSSQMIKLLAEAGIIVAVGHSDATYEETRGALDAGVTGFTHLFNAMSPLTSRAPGVVGAALADSKSWCGIIVDGVHVNPVNLQIAMRARGGAEKFMLVTDAMPNIGTDWTSFPLQGQDIAVTPEVCRGADGTLAGANLTMIRAVQLAYSLLGISFEDAIRMASINPATFLGLNMHHGDISLGKSGNLLIIDENFEFSETNMLAT